LTGKWWNNQKMSKSDAFIHVDTLARHYCTAVEVCNGFAFGVPVMFGTICLTYSFHFFVVTMIVRCYWTSDKRK